MCTNIALSTFEEAALVWVCLSTHPSVFCLCSETDLLQPHGDSHALGDKKESFERMIPFVLNLYTKRVLHGPGAQEYGLEALLLDGTLDKA